MSFTSTEKSSYKPIPEGTYTAICSAIIDLGHQDAFGAIKPQLLLRFEFPDHQVKRENNGKQVSEPMVKYQFYTNTLNSKSNLRRDLEGWRDRGFTPEERAGFDVRNVLGHPCSISIIHDHSGESVKDKIRTISKYVGTDKPEPQLELILYSKEEDQIEQWDLLPDWIKEKISQAVEDDVNQHVDADPIKDDDLPF